MKIIDLEVQSVAKRMADKEMKLVLTDGAKEFLMSKGFNPEYGARPMRRAIQTHIENPMSEKVLGGHVPRGSSVRVVKDGDEKLLFEVVKPQSKLPKKSKKATKV